MRRVPAEREAEVQIAPEDLERAKAAAERDGTTLLNALLNAKTIAEEQLERSEEPTQ